MTTHSTTTSSHIATLTGFKPTGELHLGNYAGAIRPLARLAADEHRDVYVFVADLHALNGRPDPAALADRTQRLAAALLACGLDRPNVHLYRQSRVPAIARLAALLGNVTSKGLLNRAHAYKAAVAANAEAGRDPDHGINMGLYGYPVLMAADILGLDADEVPVGADQAQHLEIAVDLAQQFARTYRGHTLREPRALITESVATLPGLDGRKMSKSYGNTISLVAEPDVIKDAIRRIVTDSTPPTSPRTPTPARWSRSSARSATTPPSRRSRRATATAPSATARPRRCSQRSSSSTSPRCDTASGAKERFPAQSRDARDGRRASAARPARTSARSLRIAGLEDVDPERGSEQGGVADDVGPGHRRAAQPLDAGEPVERAAAQLAAVDAQAGDVGLGQVAAVRRTDDTGPRGSRLVSRQSVERDAVERGAGERGQVDPAVAEHVGEPAARPRRACQPRPGEHDPRQRQLRRRGFARFPRATSTSGNRISEAAHRQLDSEQPRVLDDDPARPRARQLRTLDARRHIRRAVLQPVERQRLELLVDARRRRRGDGAGGGGHAASQPHPPDSIELARPSTRRCTWTARRR